MFSLRPLTPGRRAAHAADDQVDLHSGFGGGIEGVDDARLEQCIHLGDDLRGFAGGGVFGLAMDQANEGLGEGKRGDEQRLVIVRLGVRGEVAEDVMRAPGDLRVGGEQADVGVEAGGRGIVVAGAEVGVAAGDAVFVMADEESELAVGFEPEDAVKDLDAGVFEVARPADVGSFVEAGHEFDDYGDLLIPVLRGVDERLEDGRVAAGAI